MSSVANTSDPRIVSMALPYISNRYRPTRWRTREVFVGDAGVGGNNPIRVQSMTTTRTQDVEATLAQSIRLIEAGCEIVRITAPTVADAHAIGEVRTKLRAMGYTTPLVADIHFSPAAAMAAAEYVEKVRINPGNFADSRKFAVHEYTDTEYAAELERIATRFTPLILKCKERGVAMRIGTNHGSLSDRIMNRFGDTPEGMAESALEFIRICESVGYHDIILSMKASNPKVMIAAYRLVVARMIAEGMNYPLHLGVTEAGNGVDGRIKSAVGIGSLLLDGLGDTIRVSLTEEPEEEIPVARDLVAVCGQKFAEESTTQASIHEDPEPTWDSFHYARRVTQPVQLGGLAIGGDQTIAVVTTVAEREPIALPIIGKKALKVPQPDAIIVNIETDADLMRIQELSWKGEGVAPRPLVARSKNYALLQQVLPFVEAICAILELTENILQEPLTTLAQETRTAQRVLWLEAQCTSQAVATDVSFRAFALCIEKCAEIVPQQLLISIQAAHAGTTVYSLRFLGALLQQRGASQVPIILHTPTQTDPLLAGAASLGSLLCDGIGDAIMAPTVSLAFDLLQGSGARLTRTDYVACPSCGRTLFDLQTTTERIKEKTAHLSGVKIAIMGCVVNGPGEMADADFGYMGGSPGHVNLYVKKECVERGIPESEAADRLIELIRTHGRWVEPDNES